MTKNKCPQSLKTFILLASVATCGLGVVKAAWAAEKNIAHVKAASEDPNNPCGHFLRAAEEKFKPIEDALGIKPIYLRDTIAAPQ